MSNVTTFLAILASCFGASLLHELTHLGAARWFGRRSKFDVRDWAVHWEPADDSPNVEDMTIRAAPLVVGCVLAGVALALMTVPLWLIPGWFVYTLLGALTNDFKTQYVDPDTA